MTANVRQDRLNPVTSTHGVTHMSSLINKHDAARAILIPLLLSGITACAPGAIEGVSSEESTYTWADRNAAWVDTENGVSATGTVSETVDGFEVRLDLVGDAKVTTLYTLSAPESDDEVARVTIKKVVSFDGESAQASAVFRLTGTSEETAAFEAVGTPDDAALAAVTSLLDQSALGEWIEEELPYVDSSLFFVNDSMASHCKTTTELVIACGSGVASCIISAVNWLAIVKCGIGVASCAYTAYHYYRHGKC